MEGIALNIKRMFGNKKDNEILTLGRKGSGKVFRDIVINIIAKE